MNHRSFRERLGFLLYYENTKESLSWHRTQSEELLGELEQAISNNYQPSRKEKSFSAQLRKRLQTGTYGAYLPQRSRSN